MGTGVATDWLFGVLVAVCVGACGDDERANAVIAGPRANAERTDDRASEGRRTGKVDVGGRSLAFSCAGAGRPTVLMEAGFADGGAIWPRALVDGVARITQVCVYDRAGLGRSDPRPEPTDSGKVAADLAALLSGIGVVPPLVLVGHSLGGMHARVYAQAHPQDVAGVVLLDSSHPDQRDRARERLNERDWAKLQRSIERAFADPALELVDWERSAELARNAGNLGSRPLRVLSHDPSVEQPCSGDDCLSPDGQRAWEDLWQELQEDLAALSTRGARSVATGSAHYVQRDDPDRVVEAIARVLSEVR